MTSAQRTNVNIVLGAMTFGKEGAEQARVHTVGGCRDIVDVFQRHGHNEIDTSSYYTEGTSEQYLGDLDWRGRGIVMDTKFYPTAGKGMPAKNEPEGGWKHTPEHLRTNLMRSLEALKTNKVDMWYLHGPDRTTPFKETLKAVNDLYKEGHFRRFAISNYQSWEVAQICQLCEDNCWVKPSVYQGVYHALYRSVEPELFPCLRHYGMAFYNYNPLAGGILAGRYHRNDPDNTIEAGSRFDPNRWQGKSYRTRYWNEPYFDALDVLRPVAEKHGLTVAECALRWMTNHSKLRRENGDAVIIGASSTQHIEQNLVDLEKGSLPEEVVKALDQGWERVKGISGRYWH